LDQIKFVFCCLLAYPLAFTFSFIPTRNVTFRHLLGMTIGIFFGFFIIKWEILHSFISSTIVFFMVTFLDRKISHKYVFAFVMLYMSVSHIYRMYNDYMGWSMDFTGPQMILTIKLITFAFDYHDGMEEEEKMNKYQKEMNLKKLPSLLEFFGFVYFFGGFLAGPAFNMREYISFIDGTLFESAPEGKMPSAISATVSKFLSVIFVAVGVVINMIYPLSYARSDEFLNSNFFYKFGYIWLAATFQRFPYYFAWFLSEGSCILSGIGFRKFENGKSIWDRATNVVVLPLETGQSFKDVTDHWNIRTDRWLKHYIYERVKSNGIAITFLISALWHGFYPGYYLSFMTAAVITVTSRSVRRKIRPLFLEKDEKTPYPSKKLYDFACFIATSFMLNYTMTPFILLGWDYSLKAWSSIYFIGHIFIIVMNILLIFVGSKKKLE